MALEENANCIKVGDRQFHITGNLGKGGFSVVKKAFDEKTKKKVALKVMFTDDFKSQRERDVNISQAHKEIKAMRQLQHSNIIRLYGYDLNAEFEERTSIILVQELAMGGELFNYLLYTGKFSEPLSKYVFTQIMQGLKHAHQHGIAHRDLKPENILLDKHFQIKLADFGFAFAYMKNGDIVKMRTELGTRGYMAPEIAKTRSYDHKVDYFAAGVILFILLSGFPPFKQTENSDWWFDKIDKGKNDLFWMAHERKVSFSQPAKDLIDGLLHTDPEKRFDIEQIEASTFLTEDNNMQREEFAREMKTRYRKVVTGKQKGNTRDDSNIKATLLAHPDVNVFSLDFLIQNSLREKLLTCQDQNGFEAILEEIKNTLGGAAEQMLEKKNLQFQSEQACQALALAESAQAVETGLGIPTAFAEQIYSLMTETRWGEIEKYEEAKHYVQLEQVELPAFEADYHDGHFGVFDVRCGMGSVAYALKEFVTEKQGEMEVDMDNRKLIFLFPVTSKGEIPDGDGFAEYEISVNVVLQICFYRGEKYNKISVSRFGTDLSGSEESAALLQELQAAPTLRKLMVFSKDEEN